MESKKKIFDETHVDCNDCTHYWDDTCDGTSKVKPCTAFHACKSSDLPKRIEYLESHVKGLYRINFVMTVLFIIHLISHIIWS